jgi:hypothetical protein
MADPVFGTYDSSSTVMSHLLIAGVPVSSPPPAVAPARKEIVDFVAAENIKEFSLYVQAVSKYPQSYTSLNRIAASSSHPPS